MKISDKCERNIIFVGVLFCVCYLSYFKTISHVVFNIFCFCLLRSNCLLVFLLLLAPHKKQMANNKISSFAFGAVLLGSSVSFSFHNVSYVLLVASQVEKKNKQGRSYDSQLQLMSGSNMTALDAASHS